MGGLFACLGFLYYCRKNGVGVMSTRELFDFVVYPSLAEGQIDDYLEKIQEKIKDRSAEQTAEEQVAEAVFIQSFIPKFLDQVEDYERDQEPMKSGKDTKGIYYQTITGLKEGPSGVRSSTDAKDLATNGVFSDDEDDDDEEENQAFARHSKDGDAEDLATSQVQNGIPLASGDGGRPAEDLPANGAPNEDGDDDDDDDDAGSENDDDEDSSDEDGLAEGVARDPKKEAARQARKEHKMR